MRIRALAFSLVGCAAALALTWEVGHDAVPAPLPPQAGAGSPEPASPSAPPADSTPPSASASPAPSRTGTQPSGTFTGSTAHTPYGPVQVAIVVQHGRITDVKPLQLTNQGGRSVAISAAAAPVLRTEALRAQSAKVDTVSGATYTSDGYRTSLQSAIDRERR